MSKPSVAVVAGATGAVGHWLVKELMEDPNIDRVVALVRRPNVTPEHPKVTELLLSGDNASDFERLPRDADVVFSCVGTTIKKAGSDEAFKKTDYTFNTELASAARNIGVPQFHLVSSIGADATSSFLYPRVKGQVEEYVQQLGFPRGVVYRPGVLSEADRPEFRLGETVADKVLGWISFVSRAGYIGRVAPIPVHNVAKAMVADYSRHREDFPRDDAARNGRATGEWVVYDGSTVIENLWRRFRGEKEL